MRGSTWSSYTPEGREPEGPCALLLTLDPGVPSSQKGVGVVGCECSIPALGALLLARDDLTASQPARA